MVGSSKHLSFDDFFDNLPFVPMHEIFKHLDYKDLLTYSFTSNHWKNAIEMGGTRQNSFIDIRSTDTFLGITVVFPNDLKNCLHLGFHEHPPIETGIHQDHWRSETLYQASFDKSLWFKPFQFNFYSPKLEDLYGICQYLVVLICKIFAPNYEIHVELYEKSSDFTFQLLSQLAPGYGRSLNIQVDRHYIKCESVVKMLENITFREDLRIMAYTDKVFEEEKIVLETQKSLLLYDATFLSYEALSHADFEYAEIGWNQFTTEDLFKFVKNWKDGNMKRLKQAKLVISYSQNIDLKEVVRGMDAKKWDPKRRDRTFLRIQGSEIEGTPLQTGLDIFNTSRKLATVSLQHNTFSITIWNNRFRIRDLEREHQRLQARAQRDSANSSTYLKELRAQLNRQCFLGEGVSEAQMRRLRNTEENVMNAERRRQYHGGILEKISREWK